MGKIKVDAWQCDQCGHVWLVVPGLYQPIHCAKCRTRRWNAGVPAETLHAPDKETVYELDE